MQTALQYCTGETAGKAKPVVVVGIMWRFLCLPEMNPRRPPRAYLICEGSEPLTFTNVFPRWERSPEAQTRVIQSTNRQSSPVNQHFPPGFNQLKNGVYSLPRLRHQGATELFVISALRSFILSHHPLYWDFVSIFN